MVSKPEFKNKLCNIFRSDVETYSIDKVLCKENFHKEYAESMLHKLVPDFYLILVNGSKYN